MITGRICPFCGLATDVPHETQQGCIAALHGEIARMRQVLDHVKTVVPPRTESHDERENA